jgi:hypothetical protein
MDLRTIARRAVDTFDVIYYAFLWVYSCAEPLMAAFMANKCIYASISIWIAAPIYLAFAHYDKSKSTRGDHHWDETLAPGLLTNFISYLYHYLFYAHDPKADRARTHFSQRLR